MKILEKNLNTVFFAFINFSKNFGEYKYGNPGYKNETIRRKILNNQLLKEKKYFMELKDRELKYRDRKIKWEIIKRDYQKMIRISLKNKKWRKYDQL